MTENQIYICLKRAIKLAVKGKYSCSPNPMVGAVIIADGKIVGEGFHKRAGEPHAEINAINDAKDKTKNATLFVTLEPCCTHGRTPPCTEAIIKAGIKRVVIGTIDPNPLHAGKALDILQNAGIEVELINDPECEKLNENFNYFISTGLPFIHAKWAMTLDGKIATRTGNSKWISCDESRKLVHKLRAECDAIMTGSGTVLKDDPQLNVRLEGKWRQPIKVIIDSKCQTPLKAKILKSGAKTIIACGKNASLEKIRELENAGAKIIKISTGANNKIILPELFKKLAAENISSVFVEGGGSLLGAMFDNKLVNKATVFIAPKIIGGIESLSPVGGIGIGNINDSIELDDLHLKHIGCDIMLQSNISFQLMD
ncbi:bifunctional diaminohydroxyphosphoribosylaminopyrimidine deaminase/5-amino-6-(5-phosphoribosylamino)uracil reductase RibD [bacterium]|nr:bifunctional diaminohydroxyphosphoribosylaminopyrimidine deaminase/5-amino-6-(5-phosphoribosylamino)uracil reductase RibD [bacterium]